MNAQPKAVIRCAIYTRKSSEEGLEQSFNSLDAQREACQAFVASQRQEGWRALSTRYDDGGFSGGSMERPALKRLLKDIEDGKVNTIVVYKVDRLTRSLIDFAKIVEALDAKGVSFVSVTQQFNTTSSMGRLTLNVLLSFAQFEREVTGERIRDKIAASKRKGMWMGGTIPLGYDLKERKLVVNSEEAKVVNRIFHLYLDYGCVRKLKMRLDEEGVTTKLRTSGAGNRSGGASYSRGALYKILQNRMYLGEIHHREHFYDGEHEAIVAQELWNRVQGRLRSSHQGRRDGLAAHSTSLLGGLLQNPSGTRFTPSHTLRNGKRYRYYICRGDINLANKSAIRLPAHDIEKLVSCRLQTFLGSNQQVVDELGCSEDTVALTQKLIGAAKKRSVEWVSSSSAVRDELLRKAVRRIVVHHDRLDVEVGKQTLRGLLSEDLFASTRRTPIDQSEQISDEVIHLNIPARLRRCGGEMRIIVPPDSASHASPQPASSLLKALARGHQWYEWVMNGEASTQRSIAQRLGLSERYVSRVLECAFLAPDIVEAILDGRQPTGLTVQELTCPLPLSWVEQRHKLGFPSVGNNPHRAQN